jgi:hypothetical protein
MRISDLNANNQTANDDTPLDTVLRTILSPPLLKHLGHSRIFKFPSNIPMWTWWQAMSMGEKEE